MGQGPRSAELPPPRQHWNLEIARRVLAVHEAEGGSLAAFGRRYGYSEQRLHAWRRRLRQHDRAVDAECMPRFVPVRVVDAEPAPAPRRQADEGHVVVVVDGGRRVAVGGAFDPSVLQRAVLALEELARC
jgi:transposase-like protein